MFISQNAQADLTSNDHFKYPIAFLAPPPPPHLILNAGECSILGDVCTEIMNSHGGVCLLIHS